MTAMTSYATILKENRSNVQEQLLQLVRQGKSNELDEFLSDRKYARDSLQTIWIDKVTKEHLSLLMIAALAGDEQVVHKLLTHSTATQTMVELRGRVYVANGNMIYGVTALWCALHRAHEHVARILIDEGHANVDNGPLHPLLIDAIIRGRFDIVRFLIDHSYADINQTHTNDEHKYTALMVSIVRREVSTVEYLIKKAVALEQKSPKDGNTALAIAVSIGNLPLIQLLCMAGASPTTINDEYKMPATIAAEHERFDILDYFLEYYQYVDLIFNNLELAIAVHIIAEQDTIDKRSRWPKASYKYLLTKREQFQKPKACFQPNILYEYQVECQSIEDFRRIENNEMRLFIEALLIQERTFLANQHGIIIDSLFDQSMKALKQERFERCLYLVRHIFHLCRREKCQPSLEQYFWIFYTIFKTLQEIITVNHPFWSTFDLVFKELTPNFDDSHPRNFLYLLYFGFKIDFPDLSTLLREVKLNLSDVANIYCHGSWIQGTCTPKSDRDLIIVTYTEQNQLDFWEDFDYFHRFQLYKLFNRYDVCIYSVQNFEELLKRNYLLCVQCLFLPDAFIMKEEINFRPAYLEKYYDPRRIKQVAFYEMATSMKMFVAPNRSSICSASLQYDNQMVARRNLIFKNLFHGIRYLDLAEQLIQTRSIHDLRRVSHVRSMMEEIRGDVTDPLALDRVVDFVRIKSVEMKSRLNTLIPRDPIKGEFKVYITFHYRSGLKQKLGNLMRKRSLNLNYQFASRHSNIDSKVNRCQDIIAVASCYGEHPSITEQIKRSVNEDFIDLPISSIKINSLASNQGVPIADIDRNLDWEDQIHCFEFNYCIKPKHLYLVDFLRERTPIFRKRTTNTLSVSAYSIKSINQTETRYWLKISLYDRGRNRALNIHQKLLEIFKQRSCPLSEIEQTFTVSVIEE